MAFKPVQVGNRIDIKKQSEPLEGTFVGHEIVPSKMNKDGQHIWKFTDESGSPFSIYGFTHLDMSMQNVQEGQLCRITYQGTKKMQTKFGMKDVHQVLVEVDDTEENNSSVPF